MRTLLIAPVFPARAGNGLAMRCGMFLEAAHGLGPVDVLLVPITSNHRAEDVAFTRQHASRLVVINSEGRHDSLLDLVHGADVTEESLMAQEMAGRPVVCAVQSAPVLEDAARAVAGETYDLCLVIRAYNLGVLEAVQGTASLDRVVCDLDDDEVQFYRELSAAAETDGNALAARQLGLEARHFLSLRQRMAAHAETLTIASPIAQRSIAEAHKDARVTVVRNGIDVAPVAREDTGHEILFVGSLNYGPNADGLVWFLQDVLPAVRKHLPRVRMRVVGRKPTPAVQSAARKARVRVSSDVDDIATAYATASLAIVPILSGSGTRIKILEAGAYGVPVVSTDKGAEGLDLEDGKHAHITPCDPKAFADACIEALEDPEGSDRLATELRARVMSDYCRDDVVDFIKQLLSKGPAWT